MNKTFRKVLSCILSLNLLIQSYTPFIVNPVYAEDSTPSAATVSTPTPEVTATPTPETTPEPTPEVTPDITITPEVSPTPTVTPEIITETLPDSNTSSSLLDQVSLVSALTQAELPSPTLSTDKSDYFPTETVYISGLGFLPETTYTLHITSSDMPMVSYKAIVNSDTSGHFIYSYQLDGHYRPKYNIEAIDPQGIVVASLTFFDSATSGTIVDSDGLNDEPGQKDLTQLTYDYTGLPTLMTLTWDWDETGWSGSNTGDACSLFDTDADGYANYALCVSVSNTPATYLSKALFSCDDSRSDRCPNSVSISTVNSSCSTSIASSDPFVGGDAYPNDTQASCNVSMSDVGGTNSKLIDVCSFPSQQPNSDPSDCIVASTQNQTGYLEVKKVLSPSNDSGLFDLQIDGVTYTFDATHNSTTGEKIVDATSHTFSESQGTGTLLSNYTSTVLCKDGNGTGATVATTGTNPWTLSVGNNQDIVCIITNTRINNGSITIVKDAIPNDSQDFSFVTSGTGLSNFSLDDDSDPTLTNTKTFSNLAQGTYSVTENTVSGWVQTSATCSDGSLPTAINLSAGESVTCTFTNTKDALLHVVKEVVNDNGGTQIVSNFSFSVNGGSSVSFESDGQNDISLTPGTNYNITEPSVSGYTTSYSGCSNINLSAGQEATCTITNNDIAPSLTLVKNVTNNNGGSASANDWTLTATGPSTISGAGGVVSGATFKTGTYTLSESGGPTGYTASNWSCVKNNASPVSGNSLSLNLADTATCTIVNDDQPATLTVNKVLNQQYGGTLTCSDFSFKVNGGSSIPFEADCSNSLSVDAGTYSITEDSEAGYSPAYTNCTSIVLGNGGTATCTIVNDDQPATLIVKKIVINDNGGTKVAQDFSFKVNGAGSSIQFVGTGSNGEVTLTVNNGTYSIAENSDSQYTTTYDNCSNLVIPNGGTATCTITNNDIQPKLTVTKVVVNNHGGTKTAGEFPLFVNETSVTSGVQTGFNAGAYTISETSSPGYTSNITGDCASNGSITLNIGDIKSCTITNTDSAPQLTVIKHVVNNNGGTLSSSDFTMSVTGTNVSSPTFPGNESGTVVTLDAGSYSVDETTLTGYAKSIGSNCSGRISVGESKTCTITNDDQPATLTLVKTVVNNNGGLLAASDFPVKIGTASAVWGANTVNAGSYTVSETTQNGYAPSSWGGDCSTDGSVTLLPGDSKTCTITNDDIQPRLTVTKVVVNTHGGTKVISDFPLFVNETSVTSGVQTGFNAGSYTVSETNLPGYSSSITGDCASNGSVSLNIGDVKSCTITNNDSAPQLTVIKRVVNDNGGTLLSSDFTINVTGTNVSDSSFPGDETGTIITLDAGAYSIDETVINGYAKSLSSDCSGQIAVGESKTCTITNDDIAPKLTIIKMVVNGNTGASFAASDFQMQLDSKNVSQNVVITTTIGSHQVTESGPSGYQATYSESCPNGQISLAIGDNKTCTVTNTAIPPTLTLTKTVVNDNGGSLSASDFQGYIDGVAASWGTPVTLTIGAHTATESASSGYTPSVWGTDCNTGGAITLALGESKTCSIENDDQPATLIVKKVLVGSEESPSSFQFSVNDDDPISFDSDGQNELTVNVGTYDVTEVSTEGYLTEYSDCSDITLTNGGTATCTITNTKMGRIIIKKETNFEEDQTLFTFNPSYSEGNFTLANGSQSDSGFLAPGNYSVTEDTSTGWRLADAYCDNEDTPDSINLGAGDTVTCTFRNEFINPSLEISKSNNATTDKTPGGSVAYRIFLKVKDSSINDLTVKDLLPKGFTYRSGSYQVKVNGLVIPVTEPVYHSPGTWNIGNVNAGDEIELLYMADIATDQLPGSYLDVAWAQGSSLIDQTVLAQAQTEGYVDTNFVGTSVNVIKDQSSGSDYQVEKKVEGQVLGATTSLPATGAHELWLLVSLLSLYYGIRLLKSAK